MKMKIHTPPAALPLIGLTSVLLASCGGSGSGLIPTANAGPLERDFEEVAHLALAGNGSCAATTSAIERTEADFERVSASIDLGLRARLQEGISNLRKQALSQCAHVTATTSSTTTTKAPTTTEAPITSISTTTSSSSTTAPPSNAPPQRNEEPSGGGTRAPGEGGEEGSSEGGRGPGPGNEGGPGNSGGGGGGEIGNHRRGR
jgi:hypothetical protein